MTDPRRFPSATFRRPQEGPVEEVDVDLDDLLDDKPTREAPVARPFIFGVTFWVESVGDGQKKRATLGEAILSSKLWCAVVEGAERWRAK